MRPCGSLQQGDPVNWLLIIFMALGNSVLIVQIFARGLFPYCGLLSVTFSNATLFPGIFSGGCI